MPATAPLLTVVICTYRRNELLDDCLRSLEVQRGGSAFSVLVVDNFGTETCAGIARRYGADYVHESRTGLSHARNRGWQAATTEWVLYLDDDALAYPDLIGKILHHLQTKKPALLGGRFEHYFRTPPPPWIRWYYRESYRPAAQREFGPLPRGSYLVGGILVVQVSLLKKLGGFSTDFGMRGQEIGWAEEDELQDRARAAGYTIHYDPEMVIDHLVQPYKYRARTRVQMAFSSGRDAAVRYTSFTGKYRYLATAVFRALITRPPRRMARMALREGYYWQNLLLDTATDLAFAWGQLRNKRA